LGAKRNLLSISPRPKADFSALFPFIGLLIGIDEGNNPAAGIGRSPIVDTINITEQDEFMGIGHSRYQPGQFIIVCKHQFAHRYYIVFISDGDDLICQQSIDAVFHIQIVLAVSKVFFGGEYLGYKDAKSLKEMGIYIHKSHLPHSGPDLFFLPPHWSRPGEGSFRIRSPLPLSL